MESAQLNLSPPTEPTQPLRALRVSARIFNGVFSWRLWTFAGMTNGAGGDVGKVLARRLRAR